MVKDSQLGTQKRTFQCNQQGKRLIPRSYSYFLTSSNPFTYGLCSSRLGCDEMKKYIGHEPSGGAFNQIVLDNEDKPHNPMVNSGAIMSAALLLHSVDPDLSLSEKFEFVRNFFIEMAGGMDVGFQTSTFLSERDSADRNFALAYFMREKGCFPKLK